MRNLLGTTDAEVLFRTLDLVADGDAAGALRLVDSQADAGADLGTLVGDLLGHLRWLFLHQQLGELPADAPLTDDERARIGSQAERTSPAAVHRLVDLLRDVLDQVREGADPRLPLELALVRVCRPATELSIDALAQRISALEARSGGAPAAPRRPRRAHATAGARAPARRHDRRPLRRSACAAATRAHRRSPRPASSSSPPAGATRSCPRSAAGRRRCSR